MTDLYSNIMTIGSPFMENYSTRPLPTMRRLKHGRVHPYAGSSVYNQTIQYGPNGEGDYISKFSAGNLFPAAVQSVRCLPDCGPAANGSWITNDLYQETYIPYLTGTRTWNFQPSFNLKTLQNLCDKTDAVTGTSVPQAFRKDRSHPFYWRKRSEPAEGMTRTRDKYRVVYTEKQRRGLENEYKTNKFITTDRKAVISRQLDLSERQIKIWFQNRRAKERRDSRKSKDKEQTSASEDDNNTSDDQSSDSTDIANIPTSCRFAEGKPQHQVQNTTFSHGQCRYMNQVHLGCIDANEVHTSKSGLTGSFDAGIPRKPVSSSDWSLATVSSLIPSIDISPISENMNACFNLRL